VQRPSRVRGREGGIGDGINHFESRHTHTEFAVSYR
jgi:hypothetical protein